MVERNVSAAFIICSSNFALEFGSLAIDAKHDGKGKPVVIPQTKYEKEDGNTNTIIPDLSLFSTLNAAGKGGGGKITIQKQEQRVVDEGRDVTLLLHINLGFIRL